MTWYDDVGDEIYEVKREGEIYRQANQAFDGEVERVLLERTDDFERSIVVELSGGETKSATGFNGAVRAD